MFPNPSTGKFTIKFPSYLDNNVSIQILNSTGEIVFKNDLSITSGQIEFNLNLKPGFYILIADMESRRNITKVFISY
ncbi:MAG: T9SS type A sorting domain-containing protein [Bacteroidetes bacterium]|nr:T9SS type A sorting domain-containing protein [Bacteroidota bacterium]